MPKSVIDLWHQEFEANANQAREHAAQALQAVDNVLGLDCDVTDKASTQLANTERKPLDRATIDALLSDVGID